VAVDRERHCHETVLGEQLAVAQHDGAMSPTDLPSTSTRPAGKRPATRAAVGENSTPMPSSIRKTRRA